MTFSVRAVGYSFWILCAVGFFAILSSTMSKNPGLNPLARALDTPDSLMGFVAAASTIPGILVSLPAGSFSDIFGRRKILFVSMTVFASAPCLYLFLTSWWQLVLVRFYHGFATAMFVPVANAFVAESFPRKRGERISLFSSASAVGRTIAPFLGGYVLFVTDYGFNELYLLVGIVGSSALIITLLLFKGETRTMAEDSTKKGTLASEVVQGWATVAGNKSIMVVSLIEAAQYYSFGAVEFFLVGYLKEVVHLDPLSIGTVLGVQISMIPIVKPLMGSLSDRIGRSIPIVAGSLIAAVAVAAIPLTTQFPVLLMISVIYGIGFSTVTSATPALVSELTNQMLVGTGMGFLSTIMDVGQTLGPIATGFILATGLGYSGSFSALVVILLGACAVFVATGAGRKSTLGCRLGENTPGQD